jgi:5-formyltetrahydrofolate cyclo-ligase
MKINMKDKNSIRKYMETLRNNLTESKRKKFDSIVFDKIINSEDYINSNCIFIFVSYKSEIYTHKIINFALEDGKKVCVPKVISKDQGMIAVEIKKFSDLKPGKFNILEPVNIKNKVDEKDIDISYVPGIAFDKSGGRLGYGAGYYDRFLNKLSSNSKKIGICYDFQIIDKVPMEEHDIFMDKVLSN